MTSQILINTPNLCIMASDSSVTIDGIKSFKGVDKISILSQEPAIAIMIYGNAIFGQVQLVLINQFIKRTNFDKFENIKNLARDFIKFIEKNTYPDDIKHFVLTNFNEFKEEFKQHLEGINKEDFYYFINYGKTR